MCFKVLLDQWGCIFLPYKHKKNHISDESKSSLNLYNPFFPLVSSICFTETMIFAELPAYLIL